MATIDITALRAQAAFANPSWTSDQVEREAQRVRSVLDNIEFTANARAQFEAQAAEDERQQAIAADRRREAFNDAQSIVAKSHPSWDADSVQREADRLVAENESAIAALDLRESLADGIEPESYALGRR